MTGTGICLGRPFAPCLQELLFSIPAVFLVAIWIICSLSISWPKFVHKAFAFLAAPFLPTLTVEEAEELDVQFAQQDASYTGKPPVPVVRLPVSRSWWRVALLVTLPGIEFAGWTAVAIYNLVQVIHHTSSSPFAFLPWTPFLVALTWAYAFVRTLHRPPSTPPYDLFILYTFYFFEAICKIYYAVSTDGAPLPSQSDLLVFGTHFIILSCLLLVIFSLPLNVRRYQVLSTEKLTPTPEDHTSLASWVLFSWVAPLVSFKSVKKLEDEDVWDLSSTLKTRHTFHILSQTQGSRLLWRLIRANSLDIIIDFVFTEISLVLEFAGPFFLQRILDELEIPTSGSRQRLYGYALASFFANCLKAESDLQHLWYSRRAASRIGTQLSAAVYDKALRIIDQSGIVDKPVGEEKKDTENDVNGKSGKDTPSKTGEKGEENAEDDSNASVGKIVNIMAIDTRKIQDQVITMTLIYNAPLQIILSAFYLYSLLGWAAFVGFLPLLVSVPLSKVLADAIGRLQKGLMSAKDKRMKMIDEMFGSIKFIKFFAWEEQWIAKIISARMVEMKYLRKSRTLNILYSLLWIIVPNLVSVLSFLVFVMTGHKLTVSVAFTAIRLFDMLRQPLGVLPYALITLAQTKVSLNRILGFLDIGEVADDVYTPSRPVIKDPQELIIENAHFKWSTAIKKTESDQNTSKPSSHTPLPSESTVVGDADSEAAISASTRTAVGGPDATFELRNITVKPEPGKLTVVTGPTASGKTALLLALLGEMDRISGTATIPKNPSIVDEHGLCNSIAYAAQTPWLQQMSIKDNIIFEYPFDAERYEAVVEACALKPDFRALEDGDMTEIGAKGVSLSGGQKARVALARAVYAPTQYLILDDIFSAVDSHTAQFLFERLLRGPLLAHRTVVLVTHHVELVLPGTHYLIQMSEGRIERQGTVDELREQKLLDFIAHDPSLHPETNDKPADTVVDPPPTDTAGTPKQARKLVEDEERSEGRVKWSVYKAFMKASGYWIWVFVIILVLLSEVCEVGTRVWMSIWGTAYAPPSPMVLAYSLLSFSKDASGIFSDPLTSRHYDFMTRNGTFHAATEIQFPNANDNPLFYVFVYCGLGILLAILATVGEWMLLTGGMRSGLTLFRQLLSRLSSATFRFFDITPTGRVLNRFGKDFETIDMGLPFSLHYVLGSVISFIGAVVTIIAVIPFFTPIAFIIALGYFRLSVGYLITGRDLRRMESTTRSPILSGFSDLVSGIVTVRAFSGERAFLYRHFQRMDTCQRFWYYSWMLNRWLLFRFDILGAASVFAATIFVISGYIPVGFAALTIVSAMTFSMSVYWTCRTFTDLELNLNSVERVVEFLNVPQEAPAIVEKNRVPAYWPSSSDSNSMLVVENLEVKYAPELPSVLQNISFTLKARERVGLLGRTGCGKSTLAMSLLRFVEPAKGRIIIDGIDIATIGTQDLRSRVTFIPQDATLFAGTVRENLDPFNEHTDTECLDALARVHLVTSTSQVSSRAPSRAPSIHSDNEGSTTPTPSEADSKVVIKLDSLVAAGGHNFSSGQRQLLAMARALLRQNGVVILDEATSSIDKAADTKIQAVIREEFSRSLLLTVAHRLGTIIDYDRLIVLDKGRIAEFDTPWNLIRKENGIFREMCLKSGTYTELERAAKAHAEITGTG